MQLVIGSLVRASANLNIREQPNAKARWLGAMQKDVIARVLTAPANKWVKVRVDGYSRASEPNVVYSEANEKSSIDAKRSVDTWQGTSVEGYVSTLYLKVEDGPA